jgi:hypothetical protein
MQGLAWLGFTVGLVLLPLTGVSESRPEMRADFPAGSDAPLGMSG